MSYIDRLSGSYLIWITVVLLFAFSLSIGSCQLELLDPEVQNYENVIDSLYEMDKPLIIHSIDTQNIASYGNSDMMLFNNMETSLSYLDGGLLEKSRKTSLLTFGTERMDINESSYLTGIDEVGNVYDYGWERSATLENVSFPFAVMRDDLVRLSDQNFSEESYYSRTFLLLPEGYESVYDLNTLNATFGDSSLIEIKTFKYDYDSLQYGFDMDTLSQLFGSGLSGETLELFGESLRQFYSTLTNKELRQMMTDYQNQTREKKELPDSGYNPRILFQESMGGVTCIWGSVNA